MKGEAQLAFDYQDVADAHRVLTGHAHRTPVMTSRQVDARTRCRVFFKCENLQRIGAFKFRGAFNAICRFDARQRASGVIAYSSGNHAQAVALAAQLLGTRAVIVMPDDAPQVKLAATRGYGAEVVIYDKHQTAREELAQRLAQDRGLALIPPYDHPHVAAGQGTAAKELIEDKCLRCHAPSQQYSYRAEDRHMSLVALNRQGEDGVTRGLSRGDYL